MASACRTRDLPHQGRHEVGDGPKHAGDVGHPVAHGRARQFHAVPADDAFETIERLMIRIFTGSDVGQQAGSRDALVNDGHGSGSGNDMVMTLLTSVLTGVGARSGTSLLMHF